MRISHPRSSHVQQFRNFVFGVEDSLVSTVGVLSGVAIANVPRTTIFLTGVVLIFVEAFSMGAGSYLSESSGEEFIHRKSGSRVATMRAAMTMFFAYFLAGFIPLSPYLFVETSSAFPLSICASLVALFVLGLWTGGMSRTNILRTGLRMFLIGGCAIAIGVLAGWVMSR